MDRSRALDLPLHSTRPAEERGGQSGCGPAGSSQAVQLQLMPAAGAEGGGQGGGREGRGGGRGGQGGQGGRGSDSMDRSRALDLPLHSTRPAEERGGQPGCGPVGSSQAAQPQHMPSARAGSGGQGGGREGRGRGSGGQGGQDGRGGCSRMDRPRAPDLTPHPMWPADERGGQPGCGLAGQ